MTVTASTFDPEVLLSAPRREPGIPNEDGSLILYTVSTYSFSSHEQSSEIRVLDAKTNETSLVTDSINCSNPVWIEGETIALLRVNEAEGTTAVAVGNVMDFDRSNYLAGTINASATNLKITALGEHRFGIAFAAPANLDGTIQNAKNTPKPHSTGLIYQSLFVRHWDKYVYTFRNSIWYGVLHSEVQDHEEQKYSMSALVNPLKGTGLESPIPPDGGLNHFDISPKGLLFIAKNPKLNPALSTKCNIYLVPLKSFLETAPTLFSVSMEDMHGAMASPTFSKDGSKAAFLMMRTNGYDADKYQVFVMHDTTRPARLADMTNLSNGNGRWDRSPTAITWSHDGSSLFLTAEEHGRNSLFYLPSESIESSSVLPRHLPFEGSVAGVTALSTGQIFLSSDSLIDNSTYSVLTIPAESDMNPPSVFSLSHSGSDFGLSRSQITSIYTPSTSTSLIADNAIHCWVMKPSSFSRSKTYPLALLVHGGPQGAWTDAWSTRWNPAIFAEQGYVVVMPNITGSTGYGQAFVDGITEQWGGLPFEDLINCFDYIEKNLEYVDTERAVALGASYGGYMMNWMQGHEFGRKFKALVCHCGIFSTSHSLSTDELFFVEHDLGGEWSTNKDKWRKWDPMQYTEHWNTPQLVIHSELDYRLTMSDGLATFNVLQRQGVESEMLVFPDENHFVLKPENALKWYEAMLNWCNPRVGLPLYKKDDLEGIVQDLPRTKTEDVERVKILERDHGPG